MVFFRVMLWFLIVGAFSVVFPFLAAVINFFWVICEPYLASFFVLLCLITVITVGSLTWRQIDPSAKPKETETIQLSSTIIIILAAIPVTSAIASGGVIAREIWKIWHLPVVASGNIESIPDDTSFVSFQIDKQIYLINAKTGRLYDWQPRQVQNIEEVCTDEFALHHQKLLGRNGKSSPINFDTPTSFASKIKVTRPGTHFVWHVYNSKPKEKNGLWIKSIFNNSEPSKYSVSGWDPVWSSDGKTVFLCDNQGLLMTREGKSTYLFRPKDGQFVCELDLARDEQRIAFRVRTRSIGRNTRNQICTVDLNGKTVTLCRPSAGILVDQPKWSPDGSRVAFRQKDAGRKVRTLDCIDGDGKNRQPLMDLKPGAMLKTAGVQSFCWSPNGEVIAFTASLRGGTLLKDEGGGLLHKYDLYFVQTDGSGYRRLTKLRQNPRSNNSFPVIWWAPSSGKTPAVQKTKTANQDP